MDERSDRWRSFQDIGSILRSTFVVVVLDDSPTIPRMDFPAAGP